MSDSIEPIHFKFRWLDDEGNTTSLLRKSASYDGCVLQLDDTLIPVDAIAGVQIRWDRIYLLLRTESGDWVKPGFAVSGQGLKEMQHAINALRREALIRQERQRLMEQGDLVGLREQECRYCRATILLSGLPETPQVYCEVCDSLFTTDAPTEQQSLEQQYRICDECGMYSHPRKFTTFYFYFLFVIYGIWNKTTVRCPACMRGESWKMLLGNTPGLIGLPFSVVQLYRSYSPRSVEGPMRGLDDANIRLRQGKIDPALDDYEKLMDAQPINAGIKYNIGTGLVQKQEFQHAQRVFEMSLDDCGNYWPALQGLLATLEQQGKTVEMEAVRQLWQLEPDDDEPTENELQDDVTPKARQ